MPYVGSDIATTAKRDAALAAEMQAHEHKGLQDVRLHFVESFSDAEKFLRWLSADADRPFLGVDTETTGLELSKDHVRLVQFGDKKHGWAIPYADWRGLIWQVFADYRKNFVFHNAKFDLGMLLMDGMPLPQPDLVHDTVVMSHIVNNQWRDRRLKQLAKRFVDPSATRGQDELKAVFKATGWNWATIPITGSMVLWTRFSRRGWQTHSGKKPASSRRRTTWKWLAPAS